MMRNTACLCRRESMFIVRDSTSFGVASWTDFADHLFDQPAAKPATS